MNRHASPTRRASRGFTPACEDVSVSPGELSDPDCLFCRIVAGEIPADVVAESDDAVAFRDVNPQAPTHALVVPRSHYADAAALADAEPQTVASLVRLARDVAGAAG